MLELRAITVARGLRTVVRDVSLDVAPGEITALIGPNGGGKSTLVQAVAGLLPATGSVRLDRGDELLGRRPEVVRRVGLAVVPEGHRVLGALSVADNLRVAAHRLPRGSARGAVADALELFPELQEQTSLPGGALSGGQQQMLAIAQALVARPRYLVVDELSLGLAPAVISRLIPALRLIAGGGVGVLLIEQFTNVALALSRDAYVMEGGRIHHHGVADELRAHPDLLHSAYLHGGQTAAVVSANGPSDIRTVRRG